MTQPTQNRGAEAAGMQQLGVAVGMLEKIVPLLGVQTEAGQAVLKALNSLSKHIQPGSVTPVAQENALRSAMQAQQQNAQRLAMMRQGAAQQAQPGQAA